MRADTLTDDGQSDLDHPRRVRGDLALVHAGVAAVRIVDAQPPVIGVLELGGDARVAAVGEPADGEQVEAIVGRLALHPRHLFGNVRDTGGTGITTRRGRTDDGDGDDGVMMMSI